jgi:hypothetical protein
LIGKKRVSKGDQPVMNKILISIVLIIFLMQGGVAIDKQKGVEMRPSEVAAEKLFEKGIGEPWVGGNPPSSSSFDLKFSQYYSINKKSTSKSHIEAPKKHEVKNEMPAKVYFSYQMQALPYAQYKASSTYTGENALWIQGATSWTQYAQVPQGSSLSLLAASSSGGNGYLCEINPNGILSKNSFYFFPGSSQIPFNADNAGQYILLFIIDSKVSNSVVIDVVPYAPVYQNPTPIRSVQPYKQTTIATTSTPIPTTGDSTATIVSQSMRRYQVFLDGNYIGTEGTGGDSLDGKFTFKVVGNQNHEVRVYDGQFNYPKTMFFDRGGTKIINVEPGMAVYI